MLNIEDISGVKKIQSTDINNEIGITLFLSFFQYEKLLSDPNLASKNPILWLTVIDRALKGTNAT